MLRHSAHPSLGRTQPNARRCNSPPASLANIARRVGSAKAENVESRDGLARFTVWNLNPGVKPHELRSGNGRAAFTAAGWSRSRSVSREDVTVPGRGRRSGAFAALRRYLLPERQREPGWLKVGPEQRPIVRMVAHYQVRCHAWVLMDNRYHLMLETPTPNLSRRCGISTACTPNASIGTTATFPGGIRPRDL